MLRTQTPPAIVLSNLEASLYALIVEELKWYVGALPEAAPTRKGELVGLLSRILLDPKRLRKLWSELTPVQQQVIAEVVYNQGGRYDADVIEAKYPASSAPKSARSMGYSFYAIGGKKTHATPYDLFFFYGYDLGRFIPPDLSALLRSFVPAPAPTQLA